MDSNAMVGQSRPLSMDDDKRAFSRPHRLEVLAAMGDRLRRLREEKGLTQQQLAEASGLGRNTVARYEGGDISKFDELAAMARAVGKEWTDLLPDRTATRKIGDALTIQAASRGKSEISQDVVESLRKQGISDITVAAVQYLEMLPPNLRAAALAFAFERLHQGTRLDMLAEMREYINAMMSSFQVARVIDSLNPPWVTKADSSGPPAKPKKKT